MLSAVAASYRNILKQVNWFNKYNIRRHPDSKDKLTNNKNSIKISAIKGEIQNVNNETNRNGQYFNMTNNVKAALLRLISKLLRNKF